MTKAKHGMLLGKFMPPHAGHRYLVEFAAAFVESLTVVVGSLPSEPIAGTLRYQWMRQLFPRHNVVHLDEDLPQQPQDHKAFWPLWQQALNRVMPAAPELVFASEDYGRPLAALFNARYIPVDPAREVFPISATRVRENPYASWRFLPSCVQAYYRKKICLFGPESSGKTTLATELARHYKATLVPEYARIYLNAQQGELAETDLSHIARGQLASEIALNRHATPLLVCDTDVLTTTIWARVLYGRCDPWIQQQAVQRDYDLYLLTDVDIPWRADAVRYLPEQRRSFFQACEQALKRGGRPYVVIRGDQEQRLQKACAAVDRLFGGLAW